MNYIIGNGTFYECAPENSDELKHCGVVGMRWGVRRNTKRLSSSDSATRAKAASALRKSREKGSAEVAKLKKKGVKLEQKYEQHVIKSETKAAKLNQKAAAQRRKAYGLFVSKNKMAKRLGKAQVLETKANALTTKAASAKAKINGNDAMIKAFEREISNIDSAMVNYGKKYVNG